MSVRVFFTTAYVACSLMVWRSLVSWATVSPRYSVSTAALELWNFSVSSATAAALSGLAMGLLPRVWTSTGGWADPTTRNAPARGARGGVRTGALRRRGRRHVRRKLSVSPARAAARSGLSDARHGGGRRPAVLGATSVRPGRRPDQIAATDPGTSGRNRLWHARPTAPLDETAPETH